jgi:4-methylaminobutanoate oxidase (formaldehyde-forming)
LRPRELPARARVVIVGGGVGGVSIAAHLVAAGERDVVLVDRAELTSGSTFHSAGLVGQLRSSVPLTRMMMDSVALYRELGEECGWREVGSLRLASSRERMEELRRQAAWARTFGLPLELVGPEEARERFPLMSADGVLGAAWLPTDGYLDPSQLTYALAERARAGGARIFTHTRVTGIGVADGRVTGVETEHGAIEAEVVVNAGGMFAAELGRLAGVRVPVVPMAHEYLVTQPFRDDGSPRLPTMRDPDLLVYFREDGLGMVMGGYEREPAPWALDEHAVDRIPADFNGRLLEDDWDRFEEIVRNARVRVPAMADVRVTRLINGPEAFTPDGEFCLGETEVRGLFVAAGFCAHGLAGAGGVGKLMAEWILAGEPSLDAWAMDVRRFGAHHRSPAYTLKRVLEVYGTYYDIRYPGHERQAGRPLRVSSAYEWHRAHGAAFGEKSGWERVNWYEANAAAGDAELRPRGWAGRRRSAPSTSPRASAAASSTSRRSPRSRSRGRARPSCWSVSATTASRATWAPSPTRRCSTGAAGSSATSRSRASPTSCSRSSPAPRSAATTSHGSSAMRAPESRCATRLLSGPASRCGDRWRAKSSRR